MKIINVPADIVEETQDAFKLDVHGLEYWIPKSLCEDCGDGTFDIAEWKAIELGIA